MADQAQNRTSCCSDHVPDASSLGVNLSGGIESNMTMPITFSSMKIIGRNHRVGSSVRLQDTLYDTLTLPFLKGQRCVQFFLGGNISYDSRTITQDDRQKTLEYCDRYNRTFYIHCPLHLNIARLPHDDRLDRSKNTISDEISQLRDLPASCVLHIGKTCHGGSIENVASSIDELHLQRGTHPRAPQQLLLENAAGQGSEIGSTWDELRKIYEAIDYNVVGLCIDTQHTFAAGMCDFDSAESVSNMFDEIEAISSGGVKLFHLNDSAKPFGSKVDRHACIRYGYIWNRNDESLVALLNRCYDESIDLVLETPEPWKDLEMIHKYYMN